RPGRVWIMARWLPGFYHVPASHFQLFATSHGPSWRCQRPWRPNMFATLSRLLKNDDGATAIEYGLIAALIAVAAVTVLGTVGTNLTATFSTVATKLYAICWSMYANGIGRNA